MYVEFTLPNGAGGHAAVYVNQLLNRELHKWSDKYEIPYTKKIAKLKVKVTFDNLETYSFFALTWNPESHNYLDYLTSYRLVEPMDRPKSN